MAGREFSEVTVTFDPQTPHSCSSWTPHVKVSWEWDNVRRHHLLTRLLPALRREVIMWVSKEVDRETDGADVRPCRTIITHLCTGRSSPGTRPEPSNLLPLSPSRCCAGSSPGAAAGSHRTGRRGRRREQQETEGMRQREKSQRVKWRSIHLLMRLKWFAAIEPSNPNLNSLISWTPCEDRNMHRVNLMVLSPDQPAGQRLASTELIHTYTYTHIRIYVGICHPNTNHHSTPN